MRLHHLTLYVFVGIRVLLRLKRHSIVSLYRRISVGLTKLSSGSIVSVETVYQCMDNSVVMAPQMALLSHTASTEMPSVIWWMVIAR